MPDWHMHRDAERYMEGLVGYARPIDGPPLPGDIALFRFGRTFSHGAIIVEWPRLVHAYWAIGVVWGDATLYPLKDRPVRFFSPFANHEDTKGTKQKDCFGLGIKNEIRLSDMAADIGCETRKPSS